MNNNQLFDEHIKDQFSHFSPPVHPRIWENIAAQNEKRKPVGFWHSLLNGRNVLLFMALLIAGGSGAWYFMKNSTDSKNIIAKNRSANNNKIVVPENNDPEVNKNNTTAADIKSLPANSTVISSPDLTSSNLLSTTDKFKDPTDAKTTEVDLLSSLRKNNGITSGKTKIKTSPGSLVTHENEEEVITDNSLPVGGTLLNRLIYNAQKIAAIKKASGPLYLSRSPFGFFPDCPSMEKNTAGNKKYFELYAGPDYAFRSLKDTGNSAYLQKRKESTSFTSAYSAGIRFTRVFKNSVSVRAGINYSQINEKFTYKQGNLIQVTYIIDANGDTTGSYITSGTRYKTTHNKYRSIDVPLTIGYEVGNGKWHANINAGVVVNVYSWQKGEVLDTLFRPVNITTGKGSSPYEYKTNAGIGFIGGVSVYYKLSDKIHILAEPYYRYNLSQMTKDNLTIKQKYSTAGVRVGVRLDLH